MQYKQHPFNNDYLQCNYYISSQYALITTNSVIIITFHLSTFRVR